MPPQKRRSTKQPGDYTGRELERIRAEEAEQSQDREKELTMATQVEQERIDNTIVDLSNPAHPVEEEVELVGGTFGTDEIGDDSDVEVVEESGGEPMVVVRVNSDLKTNIGYANSYEFEAGRRYRVPLFVAQHLDEKGRLWH